MKIGFISGDLVEVDNTRKGVSVPDYPVQGWLMGKWIEDGHEVVLLSRHPTSDMPPEGVQVDVDGDPREHNLDILFGDRLGRYGSEWETTLNQIEQYEGAIVYHQYVPYSQWAPPFKEEPHLLGSQRRWMILNRSADPWAAYNAMVGNREQVTAYGHVRFERWEPFYMLAYPWQGDLVTPDLVAPRQFDFGYYGRLPQSEKRARTIRRWFDVGDWSKVIYGPETSTAWLSKATGAHDGGRVLHRDLPLALTNFNVIVQAAIDRLRNKGELDYWPHRVVESALAGVFQLFDVEMNLRAFKRWEVTRSTDLIRWMDALQEPGVLQEQVRLQQEIVLPRADPDAVHRRLMSLLEDHAV